MTEPVYLTETIQSIIFLNKDFYLDLLFNNLISIGLAYLLAIMSPGPSILAIFRNCTLGNRQIGFFTAVGTITGIAFQALYVLIGLNFLHSYPSILLYVQIVCACYLIYLGLKSFFLKTSFVKLTSLSLSKVAALKQGLLIDLLNPMALTFFISIFTIFVPNDSPFIFKVTCWFEIIVIGALWFFGSSLFFSSFVIQKIMKSIFGSFITNIVSITLILFGLQLLILLLNK